MRFVVLTLSCILLLFFMGCSRGANELTAPMLGFNHSQIQNGPIAVGVSDYFADGSPAGGTGVIGLYNVNVDTKSLKGELVPARQMALTDVLEVVDITNFLMMAPCTNCAKLISVELRSDGNVALAIGIKHPFPVGDPTKPPTGRNRADLHVFNVEGTIVSDGTSTPNDFSGLAQKVGNFELLNANGYSSYLDESLDDIFPTISTVHPYILHFADYSQGNFDKNNPFGFESVTNPGPSGNLVMPMGSGYDVREYIFDGSMNDTLNFTLAVGCTYAITAAKKAFRFTPEYRIPQHNKKAASEVKVEVVSNNLVAADTTSTAKLNIKVLDINHGVPVGTALDEMLADSSVQSVSVEIPGVTSVPQVLVSPVPISGNGRDPSNPLLFEMTVVNTAGALHGTYKGLVKVLDSYPPGLNKSPNLDGKDGIKRVDPLQIPTSGIFAIPEFATYQVFQIDVASVTGEINCEIKTNPDPPIVIQGESIIFDGSMSNGTSPIISYEWDLDYDGVNFDIDKTGAIINVTSCKIGTRDVALRVTDENNSRSICFISITINPDSAQIGGFRNDVNLGGDTQGVETESMGFRGIHTYKDDIYLAFWDWGMPGSYQVWFIRSEDRGITWMPMVQITNYAPTLYAYTANPTIWVDDNNGDIYVAYTSDGESKTAGYSGADVFIKKSSNRGDTWSAEVKVNDEPFSSSSSEEWPSLTMDDSVNPAYLYVTYTSSSSRDIHVARTTADKFNTWAIIAADDAGTSNGAYQSCILVNPIDKSVMVTWADAVDYGGAGRVMFDRSSDHGATWGTDILVNTPANSEFGPYNATIAVNPSTGVPGIMWRECLLVGGIRQWNHKFSKANSANGTIWGTSILIDTQSGYNNWAGALEVSADGHWVEVTENNYQVWFRQSQDDGVTWTPGISINDSGSDHYNPNIAFDECKNLYVVWSRSDSPGLWFDYSE